MKTKLLKIIRKKFEYKFVDSAMDGEKRFVVYDKIKSKTYWTTLHYLDTTSTHFLLELFDSLWRYKFEQKKELIRFKKL